MKVLWLFALVWMASGAPAWGQEAAVLANENADQARQRIDTMRVQQTAELDAQESACLSRFAVTDCQNRVSTLRRQMLAQLKRQESALNDMQRRQKAQEQSQRSHEKALESAQRQAERQASPPAGSLDERKKAQAEKALNHQKQTNRTEDKPPGNKAASGLDAQTLERNREAYLEKQKAAEKRRQERAQRLLEHGSGGSPLPVVVP